jgi:phosphoadenosine phosphosulfate reductase
MSQPLAQPAPASSGHPVAHLHTPARPIIPLPTIDAALAARIAASVELLRQAVSNYGRVVYANSLGAEAIVLTDLICTQVPAVDIVTIDTGRLPESTLTLLERLEQRYQRRIQVYYPQAQAIEDYVREHGVNGFYNGLEQRLSCCQIRKIEPFRRAIQGYDAWVTGVRREQSAVRADSQPCVRDPHSGLIKVSPMLDWNETAVWTYILAKRLPYNSLHDAGYPSIGCAPCTRAVEPGQEHRAGRWWWEQADSRECGLHPRRRPAASG